MTKKEVRWEDYIKWLVEKGPQAVAVELFTRDSIVAKLMTKMGVTEVTLHAKDDEPHIDKPFSVVYDVSDDLSTLTVKMTILNNKMN